MATGDLISIANIRSRYGTSWNGSYDEYQPNKTYYIAAPVFVLRMSVTNPLFRTRWVEWSLYRYRFDSTPPQWELVNNHRVTGNSSYRFIHNCTESYDASDTSNYNLWKAVLSYHNSGGGGTSDCGFYAWYGSVNVSVNGNPNTYKTGSYIYACKGALFIKGSGSGRYSDDNAFIAGEFRSAYSGDLIDDSNGYMCYSEG